jgi:hypothetical protein
MLWCLDKIYFLAFIQPLGDIDRTLQFYQSTNKNDVVLDATGHRFIDAQVSQTPQPPVRSLPLLGLPVFRKHQFVVVVGEWVIEPRFNDRVDREDYHKKISKDRYIYIHGTNREDLIGQPASAGCVCLRNADVIELYDLIPIATRVEITT